MTKVHCVDQITVHPVNVDLGDVVKPIRPLNPVVIQFGPPQATDEWEIPPAPLSIALDRGTAMELALALYQAASRK